MHSTHTADGRAVVSGLRFGEGQAVTGLDQHPDEWATVELLPSSADAPGLARRFVEDHACELPAAMLADALIIVSELVTNAVLHGLPEIRLRVRNAPPGIGLGVQDSGDDQPRPNTAEPDVTATSGRGLRIVNALASSWGITSAPPGKIVWFDLHAHPEIV